MSVGENITDLLKAGRTQQSLGVSNTVMQILGLGTTTKKSLELIDASQIRPWGCGLISLGDIRFWLRVNEEAFKEHLAKSLWPNGIAVTADLRICFNAETLAVKGGHLDQLKIEAIIKASAKLYNHLRLLAATDSFLTAIDNNSAFAATYCENPEEAVAKFSELYAPKRWTDYYLATTNLMGPLNGSMN